jgi:hypothetical protein
MVLATLHFVRKWHEPDQPDRSGDVVDRKWRFGAVTTVFDPDRTFDFEGRLELLSTGVSTVQDWETGKGAI